MDNPNYIKLINGKILITDNWRTRFGTVNKGFISDGVSVPFVFRWYIRRRGSLLIAALYHDWAYCNAHRTKKYADNAFYDIAIKTGANKFKAKIAYFAVRVFGKGNY